MTQNERLNYLIDFLINEKNEYSKISVPNNELEKRRLLRSLMNVRPPLPISDSFLKIQDQYLKEETSSKGIIKIKELTPVREKIYLWQGDITTLSCDAIVNAANSAMLGCFVPCHGCIDNAIHSSAGVQLRLECDKIMKLQKSPEPTGRAKITKAYNLPCRYVIHTVGPIVSGNVTENDCRMLEMCYRSCMALAEEYNLKSIAFCCISTGEFHFPNKKAAEIAINTVLDYQNKNQNSPEVIFNVFKDADYEIYRKLLQ